MQHAKHPQNYGGPIRRNLCNEGIVSLTLYNYVKDRSVVMCIPVGNSEEIQIQNDSPSVRHGRRA
jgi:hypothetical protein